MSELTCLDSFQLAALVFGVAFAMLALCVGCALVLLYLMASRGSAKFARKVPGLEKLISLGSPFKSKVSPKCAVDPSKSPSDSLPTKIVRQQQPRKQQLDHQNPSIELVKEQPRDKFEPPDSTPLSSTELVAEKFEKKMANADSMEEISLVADATPDELRLIKRVVSKLSQSENPPASDDFSPNENLMIPKTFETPIDKPENNRLEMKMNESADTNNGAESTVALSHEQCVALEANRRRLEAERAQMRQLGII